MESDNIRISIIVSVYNCEVYIQRFFECINAQQYDNYELIIINDGSTDNTLTLLNQFKKKNTIIIDKKNTGVSDSRNEGLKIASGELITFLDADDFIDKDYFKTINNYYLHNKHIELLCFGFFSDVEDKKLKRISSDKFSYKEIEYTSKEEIKKDLVDLWDKKMLYNIWNKVYRNDIIKKYNLKFYKYNWGEDVDFNRKYMSYVNNIYISSKNFYHYIRERKGAATGKYRSNFFYIRKKEYEDFNKYFISNGLKEEEFMEFSARRFVECVLGVIENVFCSDMTFKMKFLAIKNIIHDEILQKALIYAKPKTKKTKIMLIPIKMKSTVLTFLMGKFVNTIKNKLPGLFNHLKNTR